MAYSYTNGKGRTYILHMRETTLKNGHQQHLYFFGKDAKEGAQDSVPATHEVIETANGLPVLKKRVAVIVQ